MDNKVTMPRLAAMLSAATDKPKKLCEDFIRELFTIISDELASGESVRVRSLGSFKLVDVEPRKSVNVSTGEEYLIPAHKKVFFTPSRELAARVNSPFEMFEAVEVADDVTTDTLEGDVTEELRNQEEYEDIVTPSEPSESEKSPDCSTDDKLVVSGEPPVPASPVSEEETEAILKAGSDEETYDDELTREAYESRQEESKQVKPAEKDVTVEHRCEHLRYEYDDEAAEQTGNRFVRGFVAGFVTALVGCAIVFAVGYYLGYSFGEVRGEKLAEEEDQYDASELVAENADSEINLSDSISPVSTDSVNPETASGDDIQQVRTTPSDSPVYDTVSTTRYLTTIAKEHYGNFNLWPIIYEENARILGHPDRIRPGTKVVVPPLSKYGIDPDNQEQIREIKRKGVEIYARFK